MKKAVKLISITLIICILLSFGSCFFGGTVVWPSKEEITNTVTQNIELLNEVPNEIKSIDNSSFYLNAANKEQIDYVSITLAPIYNRVLVGLVDDNSDKKNLSKMIKSKTLFKVLKIEGINAVERYYSESGRICILFDCGGSGIDYYYGFYYTEDNQPIGWKGKDVSFNQYKNRWIYSEANTDTTDSSYNHLFTDNGVIYITERITDNWFYFEMRE